MGKKTKRIHLSRLPPEQKRKAWAGIQQHLPEHAAFIQSDFAQHVLKEMNAQLIIETEIDIYETN